MPKAAEMTDEDRLIKSMYPDLEYEEEEEQDQQEEGDELAKLREQVAKLEGQLSAKPAAQKKAAPMAGLPRAPVQPVLDVTKLPDPVEDPQGYAKAIQDFNSDMLRYNNEVQAFQSKIQSRQQGQLEALWQGFEATYPKYAENPKRVELAARQVAESARARGVDLNKYMYEQSDQFMEDVVATMDELWDIKDLSKDEDDEEDGNRTDIVPAPRGRAAKKNRGKKNEELGSMADDIREWQLKTGFHR